MSEQRVLGTCNVIYRYYTIIDGPPRSVSALIFKSRMDSVYKELTRSDPIFTIIT